MSIATRRSMKTAVSSNTSVRIAGSAWLIVLAIALLHLSAATMFKFSMSDLFKPQKSEITIELGGIVLRGDDGEKGGKPASVASPPTSRNLESSNEPGERQVARRSSVPVSTPSSTESPAAPGVQAAPIVDADYKAAYLNNPKPPYPALAFQMRIEGTVRVKALVLPDGSCSEALIGESSGNDLLDRSALNTVRQWKFVPAKSQGKEVSQWVSIPITFALKRR